MTFYEFIKDIDNQIKNGGDLNYSFFDVNAKEPVYFNPQITMNNQMLYFAPDIIRTPYDKDGCIDIDNIIETSIKIYQNIVDNLTEKHCDEKIIESYKNKLDIIIQYKVMEDIKTSLRKYYKNNLFGEVLTIGTIAYKIYQYCKKGCSQKIANELEEFLVNSEMRTSYLKEDKSNYNKFDVKFYSEPSKRMEIFLNNHLIFTVGENG